MVKRGKLPRMKVPALGGLTKNKYVLYLLLVVALVNVVGYLQVNNLDSLGLFVVSGLLASFFTKNMIVILAIAIAMGMCKTCTNYFSLGRVLEGMENEEDEEEEEEEEEDEEEGFIGFREGFKEGNMAKKGNKKKSGKNKKGNNCKSRYVQEKKGGKCKEVCKKDYKTCDGSGKKKAYKCYNDQKHVKNKKRKNHFLNIMFHQVNQHLYLMMTVMKQVEKELIMRQPWKWHMTI